MYFSPIISNYGPTILHSKLAVEKYGCHQVLWLFGKDEWLTEVGVMNIFVFWRNAMGGNLIMKL
jgi:branched-chain amino acid aminotransferase